MPKHVNPLMRRGRGPIEAKLDEALPLRRPTVSAAPARSLNSARTQYGFSPFALFPLVSDFGFRISDFYNVCLNCPLSREAQHEFLSGARGDTDVDESGIGRNPATAAGGAAVEGRRGLHGPDRGTGTGSRDAGRVPHGPLVSVRVCGLRCPLLRTGGGDAGQVPGLAAEDAHRPQDEQDPAQGLYGRGRIGLLSLAAAEESDQQIPLRTDGGQVLAAHPALFRVLGHAHRAQKTRRGTPPESRPAAGPGADAADGDRMVAGHVDGRQHAGQHETPPAAYGLPTPARGLGPRAGLSDRDADRRGPGGPAERSRRALAA